MGEILVLILILLAAVALVGRQIVRMVQDKGGCRHCPGCPGGETRSPGQILNTTPSCASCPEGEQAGMPDAEEEIHG